jgi:hypothetical protein
MKNEVDVVNVVYNDHHVKENSNHIWIENEIHRITNTNPKLL